MCTRVPARPLNRDWFVGGGQSGVLVHEVSHNINAIGDKRFHGHLMSSDSKVSELAAIKPIRASWNAYNYQHFAKRFRP
jgi:hypothetical protein